MPDLEWLVDQLAVNVRGGRTPTDAYRELCRVFPEVEVRAAFAEYEQRTGRLRKLREPLSLVGGRVDSWYLGPDPADRFWPPLRRHIDRKDGPLPQSTR